MKLNTILKLILKDIMLMKNLMYIGVSIVLLSSTSVANEIDKSVKVLKNSNEKLNAYQKSIDSHDEKLDAIVNEYKYTNSMLQNTKKYNEQLKKILNSQNDELKSLDEQISSIEDTQKNILPLMKDMIASLKILLNDGLPFLQKERQTRVQNLEQNLDKANISTHEKYRTILEAFKIEYDYTKTIETYDDKINDKTYHFLRLGTVGLYYQSLDLKDYGYYDLQTSSWLPVLDQTAKSNIKKAIKIASKQQNVDLLEMPFLAKKDNK